MAKKKADKADESLEEKLKKNPKLRTVPGDGGASLRLFIQNGRIALRIPLEMADRVARQCDRQMEGLSNYVRKAILMRLHYDEQREGTAPPPGYGW